MLNRVIGLVHVFVVGAQTFFSQQSGPAVGQAASEARARGAASPRRANTTAAAESICFLMRESSFGDSFLMATGPRHGVRRRGPQGKGLVPGRQETLTDQPGSELELQPRSEALHDAGGVAVASGELVP